MKEMVKEKLDAVIEETPEPVSVETLPGVGPKTAAALAEAGFKTVADIKNADEEKLLAVKGIGKKTVEKILAAAKGEATSDDSGAVAPDEKEPEEPRS